MKSGVEVSSPSSSKVETQPEAAWDSELQLASLLSIPHSLKCHRSLIINLYLPAIEWSKLTSR